MHIPGIGAIATLVWIGSADGALAPREQGDEPATRLATVAEAAHAESGVAGLAVGVALGGEPVLATGFGYLDATAELAATEGSGFRVGALTPALVTLGILRLVDAGALSLDDPLSRWFEREAPGELGGVTLRMLLDQTSGLPGALDPSDLRADRLEDWLFAQPLEHEPGSCAIFSPGNAFLLGRVLERVSGLSVPDFVATRLAGPLELEATTYRETGTPIRAFAASTQEVGGERIEDALQRDLFGAPGLCSSVLDLLRLIQAVAGGELVSSERLDSILHPAPSGDGRDVSYVGGFSLRPLDTHIGLTAGGELGGGGVHLVWYPDLDLSLVVLASTEGAPLAEIERRLARAFLGAPGPELIDMELPPDVLEAYVGGYFVGCLSFRIAVRDEHLWMEPPVGSAVHLTYQGEHAFAAEGRPELRLSFDVVDGRARTLTIDDHGIITVATRME